jgi:solute carrier family 25 iron transporter 28/37
VLSCTMLCHAVQLPVLRRIIAEEGWSTIWRGMKPRVLFNAPAAAVSWGTYETVKDLLLGDKDQQHHNHFPHH